MKTRTTGRQTAKTLLDAEAIDRTLSRIAHELIERTENLDQLALVGIHTRGVPLASRLRNLVAERSGVEIHLGALDITFHRDDVGVRQGGAPLHEQPIVRPKVSDKFDYEGEIVIVIGKEGRHIPLEVEGLVDRHPSGGRARSRRHGPGGREIAVRPLLPLR